ncbi:TIGR00282 family metallophosphoesterase [Acetivibrio mesophilus]|uniref:TIGR00282 family metallophosphoesterase n=1 Tax=Acetivibrio mesophilus TaxID=2487273 RepID=A0A4Q0I6B5_9FIRM|nr:TIGR00282 family metallophosphoesterase [Acetivibrio mesophilus]ODM25072.1 metallophosphoesterase [Clostridium sp. Bc-iso-3]RXE59926.1 TIGR00282 family metallophosphoesterase [Acetivibrio mesophilus]HHV29701.1 TIGR00282 family metallophosphoesterase [Clostridium sp.]
MKVLFIGDIFGNPGRKAAKEMIQKLKRERQIDFCIANGENAAGGSGITYVVAQELYKSGIDAITLGNHTWSKKEITNFIDSDNNIVRPANYPSELPGKGSTIISGEKGKIGILNLMGRVYMDSIDCPFKAAERELEYLKSNCKIVVVDMHAEATSEKCALAWYLDGRVSCVLGTHTHVQTADERILPFGTAFISDVGMTGPYDGIIGVNREIVIQKFLTHMPVRFEVAHGTVQFNAVYLEIDEKTGKTMNIERINQILDM